MNVPYSSNLSGAVGKCWQKSPFRIVTLLVVLPSAQAKERFLHTKKTRSSTQQKAEASANAPNTNAANKAETGNLNTDTSQSHSQTQSATATAQNKPKDEKVIYLDGTPIDPRHYVSGRDEKHQKTNPLLPEGAIPENN